MQLLASFFDTIGPTLARMAGVDKILFHFPQAWWMIGAVPLLVLWFLRALYLRRRGASILGVRSGFVRHAPKYIFLITAIVGLVAAFSDPYGISTVPRPVYKGEALDFVFDLSPSQKATDVSPNRLEAVKIKVVGAIDLLSKEGTWIMCIGYFTMSFNRWRSCGPDLAGVKFDIAQLDTYFSYEEGTDLMAAFPTDYKELRKEGLSPGTRITLFIFTDGGKEMWYEAGGVVRVLEPDWNEAEFKKKIAEFTKEGIRVIPVGIGGEKPVPVYITDNKGVSRPATRPTGEIVYTMLDEEILRKIAEWSGAPGRYFILREGTSLERWITDTTLLSREVDHYVNDKKEKELWQYPLVVGIISGALALGALGFFPRIFEILRFK
ncbi:MAG: hypothetical protein HYW89_03190 [Candidatus Sungiibacteriota bacterium]|uniref:Aerotolerance regulator N-terminal domain-containing protein n=1 Tax=Candidatus Sungiibacteriota bacterium TaxID=2750080 RepID=A0A7T5RJ07_9BACT|nr:MAG: hypothetical protein HYW89_03190 [Candidatus Sungbacteria bacterium]